MHIFPTSLSKYYTFDSRAFYFHVKSLKGKTAPKKSRFVTSASSTVRDIGNLDGKTGDKKITAITLRSDAHP